MTWLSSLAGLSGLNNGSLPWRAGLEKKADALAKEVAAADPDGIAFARAVEDEARRRLAEFVRGVAAYRTQPGPRRPPPAPVCFRIGSTRVLDYGAFSETPDGTPVLVVPSLVNRAYILDLTEKRSLMRALAKAGLRPFLVDWDAPGPEERGFGLTDYICRHLEPIADEIATATGRTPAVVGYCMGGLLTVALACLRPDRVSALALLATPWDFHAVPSATTRMLEASAPALSLAIEQWGELPVDMVQAMFASLDPYMTSDKFRRFADLDPRSARAKSFVALEDWLNDGVPLAGPVARECLIEWYVRNAPAENAWQVAGRAILPQDVRAPTLVVIPENDHIVPPASAAVLADAIPGATGKWLSAGHIGMVAGSRAKTSLIGPLGRWLAETAA